MKNWKQLGLLAIVLLPSIFFLSEAFSGNNAILDNNMLELTGPGAFEVELGDISDLSWEEGLPELAGTPGFSLGLIKKGIFLRASDDAEIRVIKNADTGFIHLFTGRGEIYFNLSDEQATQQLYQDLMRQLKN